MPFGCQFLYGRQIVISTAALQHSTIYLGFCATKRLCGKNAESVHSVMYICDQSNIAASLAGADACQAKTFILSVQQSFNMLM